MDQSDAVADRRPRRSTERDLEQSRHFARKLGFIVIGLVAAAITLAIGAMAASVLLKPLARAGAVLG